MKLEVDKFKNSCIFDILKKINDNGYEAYIVGGAIRDIILNKEVSDFDVTTNATPEIIKNIFSDYKIKDYGSRFGTVGVVFYDVYVEITTYRKESSYLLNRRPEEVEFVNDLYIDISRRDFTINSLAFNPFKNNGEVIDYFGGIQDINNKVIKTINNPYERFKEDGLRVLRALRFSSTLGFEIEAETSKAIKKCYKYALNTSLERRSIELNKLIFGDFFKKTAKKYKHILKEFLSIFNYENDIKRYCKKGDLCSDFVEKLSVLYFSNRELLKSESLKICINKNIVKMCEKMFSIIDDVDFSDEINIRLKTNMYKKENIYKAYKIKMLILGNNIDNDYLSNVFKNVCYFEDLDVSKEEVISYIKKKKKISYILEDVLKKVITGKVDNEKNCILRYVQNSLKLMKFN